MRRSKLCVGAVLIAMVLSVSLTLGGVIVLVSGVNEMTVQADTTETSSSSGGSEQGGGNADNGASTNTSSSEGTSGESGGSTGSGTTGSDSTGNGSTGSGTTGSSSTGSGTTGTTSGSTSTTSHPSTTVTSDTSSTEEATTNNTYYEEETTTQSVQEALETAIETLKTADVIESSVAADAPVENAAIETDTKTLLSSASSIFTEAEKAQIAAGATPHINLVVGSVDVAAIPAETKTKIEEQVAEVLQSQSAASNIMYLDLSLTKQISNSKSTKAVTDTGSDIKVSVKLPADMISTDAGKERKYTVIRLHDGVVTALAGEFDPATGELSFATNAFSTYAVAYVDVSTGAPQTGDTYVVIAWLAAMIAAAGVMMAVASTRKEI